MPRRRPPGIHAWSIVGRKPRMGRGACPQCGRTKENPESGWCNECKAGWTQTHRESHRRSQSRYARSDEGRRRRKEYKIKQRGLAGTPIRASDEHIRARLAEFRKGEISLAELREYLRFSPLREGRRILDQLRYRERRIL